MAGSTISTKVTIGVTLGVGAYPSPLTITGSGEIAPTAYGATALVQTSGGNYATNSGTIIGGPGYTPGYGAGHAGGNGGAGAYVGNGSLTNSGKILGGNGGTGDNAAFAFNGGNGGVGIDLIAGALNNFATIAGGSGGGGGSGVDMAGNGGAGGSGVYVGPINPTTVINRGSILGGAGAAAGHSSGGGATAGVGGYGVFFRGGGTLTDSGFIAGGANYGGGTASAVYFGTGVSRLILDPGAAFRGSVVASPSFAYGNALELAIGTSAGTLTGGIGAEYQNFSTVIVDPSANWTLSGANTISQGSSLIVQGTLGNIGAIAGAVGTTATYGSTNTGGNGGVGVRVAGGTFANSAMVTGGTGGTGAGGAFGGNGGGGGIGVLLSAGSLINQGTLGGGAGGNGANAVDSGGYGGNGSEAVYVLAGQVTNQGTIRGGAGGYGGRNLGSMFAADGEGGAGMVFHAGGTLTDAGVIAGGIGGGQTADAVYFGAGASRLILDPGAAISGDVVGNSSFANVLELASAASTGTLNGGIGSQFVGFSTIAVDTYAIWDWTGNDSIASGSTLSELFGAFVTVGGTLENSGAIVLGPPLSRLTVADLTGTGTTTIDESSLIVVQKTLAAGQTVAFIGTGGFLHLENPSYAKASVTNFIPLDEIDLAGVAPNTAGYSGGTLYFAGGSFPLSLGAAGTIKIVAAGDGALVTMQCFRAGTRIAAAHGDVAVEMLAIGDRVLLADGGEALPIVWIGHRHVDCTRHPRPHNVWPVCVRAGAFGNGLPRRDLYLSPDHAVFVRGVLIPVRCLINDQMIVQVPVADVTYYHVKLARHDVLLAEGLPTESYLDVGERQDFDDANLVRLFPDFASRDWEAHGCAPLVVSGPLLAEARGMIACVREGPTHERSPRKRARRAG